MCMLLFFEYLKCSKAIEILLFLLKNSQNEMNHFASF
jgi:hypothetical protein